MHLETIIALKNTGMSLKYYLQKNFNIKDLISLRVGNILFLQTCITNATFCDACLAITS